MITPGEIKKKALKYWDNQRFLKAYLTDEPLFPLDIPFRKITPRQVLENFTAVRERVKELREGSKDRLGYGYSLVFKQVNHRQLGLQSFPHRIHFDTSEDFLKFIGKRREFDRFRQSFEQTLTAQPLLQNWLMQKPSKLLKYHAIWPQLLEVCWFFQCNRKPDHYIRELDIPGLDSKFIEQHKGILCELLDQVLPAEAVNPEASGLGAHGFERRYGLKYDEPLIRFRILDSELTGNQELSDISTPLSQFKRLSLCCERVFITENKINGLSFPEVSGAIVIFGLGYGISSLSEVKWLEDRAVFYWGDIDTHGFAMLSQLRGYLPQVQSLLMDRETLFTFQSLWGTEPEDRRSVARLTNLYQEEQQLYDDLRDNVMGNRIRLEQERICFNYLRRRLNSVIGA